jgi:hypothetical protein
MDRRPAKGLVLPFYYRKNHGRVMRHCQTPNKTGKGKKIKAKSRKAPFAAQRNDRRIDEKENAGVRG